jgi:hypothetical protein
MEFNYGPTRPGSWSNGEDDNQSVLEETWMDGAVVVAEKWGTTNSKSLVRVPIAESAVVEGTTQESVPTGRKSPKKMIQGQANQVVAKQVLANKFLAKQVLANNFLAIMVLAKQGADLDLQEDVLVGQVVVVLDVGLVELVVAVETVLVRLGLVCVDTYEDHFRMSLLFTYLFMLLFMLPCMFTMYHCCL